ncbi:hypothetical protein [Cognataquiflexum rubidum]|uniref:hypothetical protein n=1 Tax=Cognataquiflexum rubidum TaxID=2922273 RepID=UPI001F142F4C|nr:hypothetical protein [Cognataquiflexum rubidum]MCH6234517.1 hypothetical protein [Cognataquiflexum rubidum]
MRNPIYSVIIFLGVLGGLLFIGCNSKKSECLEAEIPIESTWKNNADCSLNSNIELDDQRTLRIRRQSDLEPLLGCVEGLQEIDFEKNFLFVARIQHHQYGVVQGQKIVRNCHGDYALEVKLKVTDFQLITTIYSFAIVPINLVNTKINFNVNTNL